MAKIPALVTAMAEVDGRERKTVEHIARTIRERGYIPTGKRGGGAAEMTPREAANLLIALNGADTPQDAPIAIDRFRSLRPYFAGHANDFRKQVETFEGGIKPIQDLGRVNTFGEALEVLIEDVPELVEAFRSYAHEAHNDLTPDVIDKNLFSMIKLHLFGLLINFERYAAKIEFFSMYGMTRRVEFEMKFVHDPDRFQSGFYGSSWPDRKIVVSIGAPTLIAIWQALNPGKSLPCIPDRAGTDEAEDE